MSTEKTLILEVDLQCDKCYKKVHKVLCKLQRKENIRKIDYETNKNTVTLVGPFDQQTLSKKLRCKARDAIKDIKVVLEEKKSDEKKAEEKPQENKKEDKKKHEEAKASTTVNLQLRNMCGVCYPWPCSDPTHWGVQPQPHLPWGKWPPCGGPSSCGGCGSCRGAGVMRGWPVVAPSSSMCCPGPSACRGCNGCRIVRESKFSYEEYPSSACAIV